MKSPLKELSDGESGCFLVSPCFYCHVYGLMPFLGQQIHCSDEQFGRQCIPFAGVCKSVSH